MVNLMKDKIPFYNIVNMFFVGATFLLANALLFHNYILLLKTDNQLYAVLKEWSVVTSAAIIIAIYELGFVLNRVSSVLIAPILEKTKIWPKENYDIDILFALPLSFTLLSCALNFSLSVLGQSMFMPEEPLSSSPVFIHLREQPSQI